MSTVRGDERKAARNAYMREYRKRNPGYDDENALRTKRTRMATNELVNRHYDEFIQIRNGLRDVEIRRRR